MDATKHACLVEIQSLMGRTWSTSTKLIEGAMPKAGEATGKNLLREEDNGLAAPRTRYYAIVNSVCAVGRAEPGIPTQIVGGALNCGSDAACR
jgi:hypothetical protein